MFLRFGAHSAEFYIHIAGIGQYITKGCAFRSGCPMREAVYAALNGNGPQARNPIQEPPDAELLKKFAAGQDEEAFESLVKRHGPMVQGVCRRILGDVHEAEDAFQAVFLVLVRKSGSIRKPELLANWLYGVACRIARKARIRAIRKENRERQAGKMPTQDHLLDLEWAELKAVLDDELSQMPERYRAPLVLCYLRGQTNAQAAAQLGWPAGSISERLARAREILRKRLNRRGLTLSAGLLAILLSEKAASAAVSSALIRSTVQVGLAYAGKTTAGGSASAVVLELARDSKGLALAAHLKTFSIALVVALAIALLWPAGQAFSSVTQRLFAGFVSGDSGVHASASAATTNAMVAIPPPAAAGGGGCLSRGQCSPGASP
jgi:RNA polymerase sigma factor (sigma-70 family)